MDKMFSKVIVVFCICIGIYLSITISDTKPVSARDTSQDAVQRGYFGGIEQSQNAEVKKQTGLLASLQKLFTKNTSENTVVEQTNSFTLSHETQDTLGDNTTNPNKDVSGFTKLGSFFQAQNDTTSIQSSTTTSNGVGMYSYDVVVADIQQQFCPDNGFIDIQDHQYKLAIEYITNRCVVQGNQVAKKYYPDNYVRRADAITILSNSFGPLFLEEIQQEAIDGLLKVQELPYVQTTPRLMHHIALNKYMKVLKFFGGNETQLRLNTFVTQHDIIRAINVLGIQKSIINKNCTNIFKDPDEIVTRGQLAHVIHGAFDQDVTDELGNYLYDEDTNDIEQESENTSLLASAQQTISNLWDTDTPSQSETNTQVDTSINTELQDNEGVSNGWDVLFERGIINPTEYSESQQDQPISRQEFLILLVKTQNYFDPSIPVSAPGMNYFADIQDTQKGEILSQAKNLGLTSFFERLEGGKLYIDPDAVVTQYQAAIAINRIAPKLFKVQPEMEKVLVPKSTVAEMITVAFGLKRKADYIQRMDLEDIRDKISGIKIN